jgi:hypothetical protein
MPRSAPGAAAPASNALLSRIGRLDFVGRGMALTVLARLPSMKAAVEDAVSYAAEMSTGGAADPVPCRHRPSPTIRDLQAEFPDWDITTGLYGMYYAEHRATGKRVHAEDLPGLRDQIRSVIGRADRTA